MRRKSPCLSIERTSRARRKRRIRKKVSGDSRTRPRLTVFRSSKHIYAQVIDDRTNTATPAAVSTRSQGVPAISPTTTRRAQAKVGKALAAVCKAKGITKVVFDRNGYAYHGRVKALAEGAREAGLEF